MRSDAGFDRFISEGLKEAAGRVEVPARCKTEIDMRIVSAESDQQTGGTKQMRNWTFSEKLDIQKICSCSRNVLPADRNRGIRSRKNCFCCITRKLRTKSYGICKD